MRFDDEIDLHYDILDFLEKEYSSDYGRISDRDKVFIHDHASKLVATFAHTLVELNKKIDKILKAR